ncbi:MAG: hypothetical protein A4E68_01937 [Syntrophaceae bacterium PtaB.Bin095]|jgi:hypothetical protein|nr:MAG: hypothetical protein A4E68_01937 [Syntrophaceae bacterium PtaB.Bin095]
MSELYVSQVLLEVNGQSIADFQSVEENEYEVYKPVNLMNGTGHLKTTERYGLKLDYVVPADSAEFDFNTVAGGTITIDRQNGKRTTYTGVYVTKIGAAKYDGEKEVVRTIEFSAKARKEN